MIFHSGHFRTGLKSGANDGEESGDAFFFRPSRSLSTGGSSSFVVEVGGDLRGRFVGGEYARRLFRGVRSTPFWRGIGERGFTGDVAL